MQIGHSKTSSMTFLPNFYLDQDNKILYIDIAGLNDTGGINVEIFNQLITKWIFNKVGPTKMIIPGTKESFLESRGDGLRKLLKLLQRIFRGSIDKLGSCIHPIVTQVNPKHEFEIDELQCDFDKIFDNYLKGDFCR